MSTINERVRQLREDLGLSREKFAGGAHRTQSEIKNIEYGKTFPKEEIILSICSAYNVCEVWLRTGEGEMYRPMNRDQEIASFMDEILRSEDGSFRRRLIAVLSKLNASEWELLEKMACKLAASCEKEGQAGV